MEVETIIREGEGKGGEGRGGEGRGGEGRGGEGRGGEGLTSVCGRVGTNSGRQRGGGEVVDVVPLTCTVCRGAWQLQRHHDSS